MYSVTVVDSGPSSRRGSHLAVVVLLWAAILAAPAATTLADDEGDDDGPPPAPGPNIVFNGDFEAPVICPVNFAPNTPPAGWTLETASVDLVCFTHWEPASGLQSVDMTGSPGQGTVSQNLLTEPGQTYLLRFAAAGNPSTNVLCPQGDPIDRMEVRWEGALIDTVTHDVTGHDFMNMGWTYHEYVVIASGALTELEFKSLTGAFCGPTLDDVSVRSIELGGGDDDGDDDGGDDDD